MACRCGSASHIGVHCNISTVGVGKTLLHRDGLNERATRNTLSEALQAMRANETALPDRCYMKRTLRGESVVCMDLMSEGSGEVLGVAVAGMHGSQRPLYISRGAKPLACDTVPALNFRALSLNFQVQYVHLSGL